MIILGFRPLSGYSFSNEGRHEINGVTEYIVFVPSRGIRFLITKLYLLKTKEKKKCFRPLSGYSFSNPIDYAITNLCITFSSPLGVFVF